MLKRFKNRLICKLIGHCIDPCDCYASECYRCGFLFPWNNPPRSDLGFWLTWFDFQGRLRSALSGRLCEVCGNRLRKGKGLICGNKKCADEWMPF